MTSVHEEFSRQFREWETPLRGWKNWGYPVALEPPFRPFFYQNPPAEPDDGVRQTVFSSWIKRAADALRTNGVGASGPSDQNAPPEPEMLLRDELVELAISFPQKIPNNRIEDFKEFLCTLEFASQPVSFEIIGTGKALRLQLAVDESDAATIASQFKSQFPELRISRSQSSLASAWQLTESQEPLIVQLALAREPMLLLSADGADRYTGLLGAFSGLEEGEIAIFQVIFQGSSRCWAESILRTVIGPDGQRVFVNAPELESHARRKVSEPLFLATMRLAVKGRTFDRTGAILRAVGGSLAAYGSFEGNALVPLENNHYPFDDHEDDLLRRQSRRTGMLLNSAELAALVHIPTSRALVPKLLSKQRKTRALPESLRHQKGVLLGVNEHEGEIHEVRLTPDQRARNVYIIGTPGTGKSTLMLQMAKQDLASNNGFAVLDPHGDLIESILRIIPPERVNDVILLDVTDEEWSVGLNILSAHSETERSVLASDLVSIFERLSTSWGDQMGVVLQKALLVFLESPAGGTLLDLERFLIDQDFRKEILGTVDDPGLVYYWNKVFPLLSGNRSVGPILTRLQTFLSSKRLRNIVAQRENRIDFSEVMNSGKIFLAKLSQGSIGKENARLLGSFLMAKFQQAAMRRHEVAEEKRRFFCVYADEFPDYVSPSIAEILAGARKYKVGLVLAHQEVGQLDRIPEVASAVRSAYTHVCFRVTDRDAKLIAPAFLHFEAEDFQQLGTGEAILRIERSDYDLNVSVPPISDPPVEATATREAIVLASRANYSRHRDTVEADIRAGYERFDLRPKAVKQSPQTQRTSPTVHHSEPRPLPSPPRLGANAHELGEESDRGRNPEIESESKGGRGGYEHTALQKRIRDEAQALGFLVTLEVRELDGRKWVDLVLERGDTRIAVETSVTTPVDKEVGNIMKCLEAGYNHVAVVSSNASKLQKIKAATIGAMRPDKEAFVHFYSPDSFISQVKSLRGNPQLCAEKGIKDSRGYKVKRSVSPLLDQNHQ